MMTSNVAQTLILSTERKLTLHLPAFQEPRRYAQASVHQLTDFRLYGHDLDVYALDADCFFAGNDLLIGGSEQNADPNKVYLFVDTPSFQKPRFSIWNQSGVWHYASLTDEEARPRKIIVDGLELRITPQDIHAFSLSERKPAFGREDRGYLMIEGGRVMARFHFNLR